MDVDGLAAAVDSLLVDAEETYDRQYPGPAAGREPIQTLYVAAGDFHDEYVRDAGRSAEQLVFEHAEEFLQVLGGDDDLMGQVLEKLATEPVEDLRIDFAEPVRDDAMDQARVDGAASAWATAVEAGAMSPLGGIRVPGLAGPDRTRSVRTVGRFLGSLGTIPEGFVVTVGSVTTIAQIEALVRLAELIEKDLPGRLSFEVQLESPRAVLGPRGSALVTRMIHSAEGRLRSVHLVPESFGGARLADHALTLVCAATHGSHVRLADASMLVVPRQGSVVEGWRSHLDHVRRALARGFEQGRDSHASQLPTRYAAMFADRAAEAG